MPSTPAERSMRNRATALAAWAKTPDEERTRRSRPGHEAFLASLDAQIPAEITGTERARRLTALTEAHYLRMQAKSLQVRRENKERREREAALALLQAADEIAGADAS